MNISFRDGKNEEHWYRYIYKPTVSDHRYGVENVWFPKFHRAKRRNSNSHLDDSYMTISQIILSFQYAICLYFFFWNLKRSFLWCRKHNGVMKPYLFSSAWNYQVLARLISFFCLVAQHIQVTHYTIHILAQNARLHGISKCTNAICELNCFFHDWKSAVHSRKKLSYLKKSFFMYTYDKSLNTIFVHIWYVYSLYRYLDSFIFSPTAPSW